MRARRATGALSDDGGSPAAGTTTPHTDCCWRALATSRLSVPVVPVVTAAYSLLNCTRMLFATPLPCMVVVVRWAPTFAFRGDAGKSRWASSTLLTALLSLGSTAWH